MVAKHWRDRDQHQEMSVVTETRCISELSGRGDAEIDRRRPKYCAFGNIQSRDWRRRWESKENPEEIDECGGGKKRRRGSLTNRGKSRKQGVMESASYSRSSGSAASWAVGHQTARYTAQVCREKEETACLASMAVERKRKLEGDQQLQQRFISFLKTEN